MNQFDTIKAKLREINPKKILEDEQKNGAYRLCLHYNPNGNNLDVGVLTIENTYIEKGTYECAPEVFAVILTQIINDPYWNTGSSNEIANIFVEYGGFR